MRRLTSVFLMLAIADAGYAEGTGAEACSEEAGWGKSVRGVEARIDVVHHVVGWLPHQVLSMEVRLRNVGDDSRTCYLPMRIAWRADVQAKEIVLDLQREAREANLLLDVDLPAREEKVVAHPAWKPRFLIEAEGWGGDPGDYAVPILRLPPGEYAVRIRNLHARFRVDGKHRQVGQMATGHLPLLMAGTPEPRKQDAPELDGDSVRIAWGPEYRGIKAGIARGVDGEGKNICKADVFLRNAGRRELAVRFCDLVQCWRCYGFDHKFNHFQEKSQVFGFVPIRDVTIGRDDTVRIAGPKPLSANAAAVGVVGQVGLPSSGAEGSGTDYRWFSLASGMIDLRD